jgi:hypothetical protein
MIAIAFACGRAGTSQSSAPSEDNPMTTVPSGAAATTPGTARIKGKIQKNSERLVGELMFVLSTT